MIGTARSRQAAQMVNFQVEQPPVVTSGAVFSIGTDGLIRSDHKREWLSPAFAQEKPAFSGFKVEGIAGYDDVGIDPDDAVFGEVGRESEGGLLYGIGIGYDHAIGGVVFGEEAELSDSTAGIDAVLQDETIEESVVSGTGELDAGRDIYVGVRAGTLVTPKILLYVKGG